MLRFTRKVVLQCTKHKLDGSRLAEESAPVLILARKCRHGATWQQRPSLVQLGPSPYEAFFGHAFEPKLV
jgi:hypothetical protein